MWSRELNRQYNDIIIRVLVEEASPLRSDTPQTMIFQAKEHCGLAELQRPLSTSL
jgi:hypothetical protein